jgi:hypothetical protein
MRDAPGESAIAEKGTRLLKTALLVALIGACAVPLASCNEEPCTQAALQQKQKDLQDAMTAALAKDPAKAASDPQAWSRALDLMARARSAGTTPSEELCKAYDEQIKAVRNQPS